MAHPTGGPGCADDRHPDRVEQALDRSGLAAVLAGGAHGEDLLGGLEVEGEVEHPVLHPLADHVARLTEGPQHPAVVGQDLGHEPAHARLPGRRSEVLEQHGAQPPALVVVTHHERHLGVAGVQPVEARHRDQLPGLGGHEGDPVGVVDVHEPRDVPVRELRVGGEEPEVDGLGRQLGVELDKAGGVVGTDRAHVARAAVPEHHIGLPMGRVLGCHGTTLGAPGTSVDPVGPGVGDNVGLPRTKEHHGPSHTSAQRARRRPDRRHRHHHRDAGLVPRVRLLGHLLPCPARCPRWAQAGAAPHPLHDERDGPAARPRARQERPRRGRGHGQAAPAR